MDVFLCGEALWISCGTWLGFWNGVIGAFTGAVLAAGVAMLVVWRTNKHQTKLVDRQLDDAGQKATAALGHQKIAETKALQEQRAALNKQLTEQRESLRTQLDEQRREASKNREHAAIAEVLGCLAESHILLVPTNPLEDTALSRFAAAAGRWELETADTELRAEIPKWTLQWWWAVRESRRLGMPTPDNRIGSATTRVMLDFARGWTHADAEGRETLLSDVADQRDELRKMGVKLEKTR